MLGFLGGKFFFAGKGLGVMWGWGLCTFGDSGFFLDKSVARFNGIVFAL